MSQSLLLLLYPLQVEAAAGLVSRLQQLPLPDQLRVVKAPVIWALSRCDLRLVLWLYLIMPLHR